MAAGRGHPRHMTYNAPMLGQRRARFGAKDGGRCPADPVSRRLTAPATLHYRPMARSRGRKAALGRPDCASITPARSLPRACIAARPHSPARQHPRLHAARRRRGNRPSGLVRGAPAGTRVDAKPPEPDLVPGIVRHRAAAAAFGDATSLGFVTETERQVEGHLASHLDRLPANDQRSRAIVEWMKTDEARMRRPRVRWERANYPDRSRA